MTNEEIHRTSDLRRFRFDSIPQEVFDNYRAEFARLAAFLHSESREILIEEVQTPLDINVAPECFMDYDEITQYLIEQGVTALEIGEGKDVVIEITPDQYETVMRDYAVHMRAGRWANGHELKMTGPPELFIQTPSGVITIVVKPVERAE